MDTAHRPHQNCGQVFRYGIPTGRCERDPSRDLRGALAPAKYEHFPAITEPVEAGKLLRAIDAFQGTLIVQSALQLAPLVMARTILHQELDIKPEVIEHQLAHRVPDALGTAYNRTKFIKERRKMMQKWADYLDKLKAGAEIISIRTTA